MNGHSKRTELREALDGAIFSLESLRAHPAASRKINDEDPDDVQAVAEFGAACASAFGALARETASQGGLSAREADEAQSIFADAYHDNLGAALGARANELETDAETEAYLGALPRDGWCHIGNEHSTLTGALQGVQTRGRL